MTGMFLIGVAMAATGMQPTTATGAQATQPRATGADRVVCRREGVVGTRFTTRTCRTRAEWVEHDERARSNAMGIMDETGRASGVSLPSNTASGRTPG